MHKQVELSQSSQGEELVVRTYLPSKKKRLSFSATNFYLGSLFTFISNGSAFVHLIETLNTYIATPLDCKFLFFMCVAQSEIKCSSS